jgi:hypothetical protein
MSLAELGVAIRHSHGGVLRRRGGRFVRGNGQRGDVAAVLGNCKHSRLTPLALEVNDLVRGSQQCSVASPQLCALVEVPAGESVGVGGS